MTCILLPQTDPTMNRNTSSRNDFYFHSRKYCWNFLENRFTAEQTMDYANRPTILRFANDTIDEPVRKKSFYL